MGMDYRYLLHFERDARFDVLEHLAAMASPTPDGPTTLVLPDRTVELPFGTWSMPQRRLAWDDPEPSWEFMTVLCFPPDGPIEDYLDRLRTRHDGQEVPLYDDQGRAQLGIVYLTVHNDLGAADSGTGEELVLFDFSGPGSSMSVLFSESDSIRVTMMELLESCRGVYGVFDREDEADLFWLRGLPREDRLPTADLSLAEIEALRPVDVTVSMCASCGRQIPISRLPGGNPIAAMSPDENATSYGTCASCERHYCSECLSNAGGTCPACHVTVTLEGPLPGDPPEAPEDVADMRRALDAEQAQDRFCVRCGRRFRGGPTLCADCVAATVHRQP